MLARHQHQDLVAFGPAGSRTWDDLLADVAAVRSQLPAVDPEGCLLLVFENDAYFAAVGLLAAWTAGHAVAVPESTTSDVMRGCLEDSRLRGLLHDTAVAGHLSIAALLDQADGARSDSSIDFPRLPQLSVWGPAGDIQTRDLDELRAIVAETWGSARPARIGTSIWPGRFEGLVLTVITALLSGSAFARESVRLGSWPAELDALISTPAHLRTLATESSLPRLAHVLNVAEPIDETTKARVEAAFGCAVRDHAPVSLDDREELLARLFAAPGVQDAAVASLGDARRWAVVVGDASGTEITAEVAVCERVERDAAGVARARDILRAFGLDARGEPMVQTLEFGPAKTEGPKTTATVHVPANYRYFDGHFDGYPILPGVAQLHELVLPLVARARPAFGALQQMLRLKFLGRIEPGDEAVVALTFSDDAPVVDFEINVGPKRASAGRMRFAQTGDVS